VFAQFQHWSGEAFPLVRSGGLFVAIVGLAMLAGGLRFGWRNAILGVGAAIATAATAITAARLTAPFGAPTLFQIGDLIAAVALEFAALAWVIRRFRRSGERAVTLATLMIVAVHFVLMAPAFGPLIALLGVLAAINAYAGVWFRTLSVRATWIVDGALKVAIGAAMFAQMAPS
jgi:hypothetical protein